MKKILIVEDSPNLREVLEDILDRTRYTFLEAENGLLALDIFKKEQPDLVLLDVLMPEMDGATAFNEIKKIDSNAKVAIVSVVAKHEIEDRFEQYTPDGYITKPFDINELRELVCKILEC